MITIKEIIQNQGQVFSYGLSEFPEINSDSCTIDNIVAVDGENFVVNIIDSKHFSIQPQIYGTSSTNILLILKYLNTKTGSGYSYKTFEILFKAQKPRKALIIKNNGSSGATVYIYHLASSPLLDYYSCVSENIPIDDDYSHFSSTATSYYTRSHYIPAGQSLYLYSTQMTGWGGISGTNRIVVQNEDTEVLGDISALINESTTLSEYCFYELFNGSKFNSVPKDLLSQFTTLSSYCYGRMFYGCTELTKMPLLPATSLATYCYYCMFYGCTSLINAEVLPATTVPDGAYYSMFYNCTSLEKYQTVSDWHYYRGQYYDTPSAMNYLYISEIPDGETLDEIEGYVPEGYIGCFYGVNYITGDNLHCIFRFENNQFVFESTISDYQGTVLSEETFSLSEGQSKTLVDYGVISCYHSTDFDCPALETTNATYGLQYVGSYRYNGGSYEFPATSFGNNACYQMFQGCTSLNCYISLSGNPTIGQYSFYAMFKGCSSQTNFNIPRWGSSTTVSNASNAFKEMYSGTAITSATIPTIKGSSSMFESICYGCTSLRTVDISTGDRTGPVSLSGSYIFRYAFWGCTSLTSITYLYNTVPNASYMDDWVYNVSGSGTFTKSKYATWSNPTKGQDTIPTNFTITTSTYQ